MLRSYHRIDMTPIFTCFYTVGTRYEREAHRLRTTLDRWGLEHDLQGIPNFGSWKANAQYTATHCLMALDRHVGCPVVQLDADAYVHRPPQLLFELRPEDYDIALHRRRNGELLNGTMWLGNTPACKQLLVKYQELVKANPDERNEMKFLDEALRTVSARVFQLPAAYCWIHDVMRGELDAPRPIIEHLQASRVATNSSLLPNRVDRVKELEDRVWLQSHESERMDPHVDIWPPDRRQAHLDRYIFAKRFCMGRSVVDAACGTGYGTAILSRLARHVMGVDVDQEAVQYATRKYNRRNAKFVVTDVRALPVDSASYDAVVSFETLEHVESDKLALAEFSRILGPAGTLIVSVPHLWTGDLHHHLRVYDRMRLSELLSPVFSQRQWFAQIGQNKPNAPAGIVPLTDDNVGLAEWLIVIAKR